MHPRTEAGLLEQHRCHKAHDRVHDADDHQRDGIGDELRTICGPHEHKRQSGGQFLHHEKFQHAGNGNHDRHLVQSHNKGGIGDTACVQRHIVNDHAIDHNCSHDNGKEDTFR